MAERAPGKGFVAGLDRFQRRQPLISFPLSVIYKFFEDQGNYLAATMTYYAFIAIFPLMLLGTSILGFVLEGRPNLQKDILDSALSQFPIIGDQLGRPGGLTGSTTGVIVGALAALYGALGLGMSLQNTMHITWAVPRNSRPNPIIARVKALVVLATAGTSLLSVSVVSAVATTNAFSPWLNKGLQETIPYLTVFVVGIGITILFRFAATGNHSLWKSLPGGFTLALLWQGLQYLGTVYVSHVLIGTTSMVKVFGLVLGLIGLLYIGAVMAVIAIEVNVVIARRLYPRALLTPFTDRVDLTDADKRAYASYPRTHRHKGFETIDVRFGTPPHRDGPRHTSVPQRTEETPGDGDDRTRGDAVG